MRARLSAPLRALLSPITRRIDTDPNALQAIRSIARTRSLVYVLPSASLFDYLLMNAWVLQHDLPLARFANDVPMLWFQPFLTAGRALLERARSLLRRPSLRAREESRHVVDTLAAKQAVLLFLHKPGLFSKPTRWHVLVWEELIRAERKGRCKTAAVPITFLWGRRAGRIERTLTDVLLGDTESPGFLRKIAVVARHYREATIRLGPPVDLERFLSETQVVRDEVAAKKLRRLLSSYLFRERKLLAGPPLRSRERIIRTLLRDPELTKLVTGVARREKKTEAFIWKRAEKILMEMIADFNQTSVAIGHALFRWLWARLYDTLHIDETGLERVKAICRDYPVILVPSHKSHMDYMLLSAIFYEHGLSPPHIAAGDNLTFWPVGYIFRRNGAFFIRRRIEGDLLYARLLGLYVRWLIRAGYSQEFFIEGGRTRTGKLVFPKHGLLGMQLETVMGSSLRDLYIVPIAVTYEKVLEESSYRAELSGRSKEKENVWGILRSRKLLSRRHGAAYVRFGEPISARKYFGIAPGERPPLKEKKEKVAALASGIIRDIASQTMVTTTALTAAALLAQRERGIMLSTLRERLSLFANHLLRAGVPCSPEVREIENYIDKILGFFFAHRWIVSAPDEEGDRLFIIREDRRLNLDFYKNTILHYFLPASLAAWADKAGAVSLLYEIVAQEFHLDPDVSADELVRRGHEALPADSSPPTRRLFAGLILNYCESYDLAARTAIAHPFTFPASVDIVRKGLVLGNQMYATGEITRREAISSANLQSAFTFFHRKGLLEKPEELRVWQQDLLKLLGRA